MIKGFEKRLFEHIKIKDGCFEFGDDYAIKFEIEELFFIKDRFNLASEGVAFWGVADAGRSYYKDSAKIKACRRNKNIHFRRSMRAPSMRK